MRVPLPSLCPAPLPSLSLEDLLLVLAPPGGAVCLSEANQSDLCGGKELFWLEASVLLFATTREIRGNGCIENENI